MQKLARDRVGAFAKGRKGAPEEDALCLKLGSALKVGGSCADG